MSVTLKTFISFKVWWTFALADVWPVYREHNSGIFNKYTTWKCCTTSIYFIRYNLYSIPNWKSGLCNIIPLNTLFVSSVLRFDSSLHSLCVSRLSPTFFIPRNELFYSWDTVRNIHEPSGDKQRPSWLWQLLIPKISTGIQKAIFNEKC